VESKFYSWYDKHKDPDNVYPPAMDSQFALNILIDYILGEDWYVVDPLSNNQINTVAVDCILYKCSKKYRKEVKQHHKGKTD